MAQDNTLTYGGLALVLFLLFSGSASAKPGDLPIDTPDQPTVPPSPGNWGATPIALIPLFEQAEQASGIPGLGRFLSVRAWSAFRAGQPLVSPEEAAQIAAGAPELCRTCHNTSASERIASRRAWESVTLPKGEAGLYGTGRYSPPWPTGPYGDAWADFGSAGLLDFLAGSNAHAGIHEGKFAPLINYGPEVLFRLDVQMYLGGVFTRRVLVSPNYKVLKAGDSKTTWTNIQRVFASPEGFVSNSQYSQEVGQRFQARAQELGIDLSQLAYPWPINWPGAASYYSKLGVLKA